MLKFIKNNYNKTKMLEGLGKPNPLLFPDFPYLFSRKNIYYFIETKV